MQIVRTPAHRAPGYSMHGKASGRYAKALIWLMFFGFHFCSERALAIESEPDVCIYDASGTLTASPAVISAGGSTTLAWSVASPGCLVQVKISGLGIVGTNGSRSVTPQAATTTWQLTATRAGVTRSLSSITVTKAPATEYSDANTPMCRTDQINRFDHVYQRQSRTDVIDPAGHYMGWNQTNNGYFVPADAYKRTLCGQQHHYSYYNPWLSGDEADANIYVFPGPGFEGMMNDPIALGLSTTEEMRNCDGAICMCGEITYDNNYINNGWYPPFDGASSPVDGKYICMYGPWLLDEAHHGRPEIHPSEAVWWREPAGIFGERTWIELGQDDSNRYDRRADFSPDMSLNENPWSAWPRKASVRKAFLVPKAGSSVAYFDVFNSSTFHVTTGSNPALGDATPGTRHVLNFNQQPRVVVVEHQPDADIGVTYNENASTTDLHDVCLRSDGMLQGYVSFRTQFGIGDRGGEGWHSLVVYESNNSLWQAASIVDAQSKAIAMRPKAPAPFLPIERTKVDLSSIRFVKNTRSSLASGPLAVVGDLILSLQAKAVLREARDDRGSSLSLSADTSPNNNGTEVRLRNLDLSSGQPIHLTFANGESVSRRLPGIALTAELDVSPTAAQQDQIDQRSLDIAWAMLIDQINARKVPRPDSFTHMAAWLFEARPKFSASKGGRAYGEDEFKIAEKLNRAQSEIGSATLIFDQAVSNLHWSVPQGKTDISSPISGSGWKRRVSFPDGSQLAHHELRLQIDDIFGVRSSVEHSVWSHMMTGSPAELLTELPSLIASMSGMATAGIGSEVGAQAGSDDENSYREQHGHRRALDNLMRRSSADGCVTPRELQAMITAARRMGDSSEKEPD